MKWVCNKCENDDPCIFSWPGGSCRPERCPHLAPKTDWQKIEPDKPAPHVVTKEPQVKDDEIVKLADKLLYEHSLEGSRKALRPVFRLIAAEIENNSQLFTGLYEKFGEIQQRSFSNKGNLKDLKAEIEGVQEHLDEHNSDFVSNNMDHEDLERKVEELETRVKNTNINLDGHCQRPLECVHGHRFRDPKPQPPQDVTVVRATRCKDFRGILHDLKVQQSVVSSIDHKTMLFLGTDKDGEVIVFIPDGEHAFTSGRYGYNTWAYQSSELTWIRDLDFPPFDKAQDVGGGK